MKEVIRHGVNFLVVDDTENRDFWDYSNWESDNYKIILDQSKKHNTFINAGGWIGPFTLYASKLFENVFSLEPDNVAFDELKRNVDLNNFKNVKIFNIAFLDENKSTKIGSNFSNLGRSGTSIFQEKNSINIDCVSLRNFFEKNEINKNAFLMLDVEGSEYLLFDDYEFFKTYTPTILLSLHLTFLDDKNYLRMINSLEKLKDLYNFDLEFIIKSRKNLPHNGKFQELNILMEIKK